MRLWSLHPRYLDRMGLVAVWREGLLARHVLSGNTKGYKNHPQLYRFKRQNEPISYIDFYLYEVAQEASNRGYKFDITKLGDLKKLKKMTVNNRQIEYESKHLINKLQNRSLEMYQNIKSIEIFDPHPLFLVVDGDIEEWEIINGT